MNKIGIIFKEAMIGKTIKIGFVKEVLSPLLISILKILITINWKCRLFHSLIQLIQILEIQAKQ